METFTFSLQNHRGDRSEYAVGLGDYYKAGQHGMTLSQHLSNICPTREDQASAFEQAMYQAGIFINPDHRLGIRPTTLAQILDSDMQMNAGAIRAPDGSDRTVAGRMLYPEVLLQTVETMLRRNDEDFLGGFNRMVAVEQSVNQELVQQPLINVSAPEGSRAQRISQGAEPARMVSITTADRPHNVPTRAIGLEVTDQALQATTIDMVGLTLAAQARGERLALVEEHLQGMISGDPDLNEAAITDVHQAKDFDSSISTVGKLTQRAWIKWLRNNYKKMSIDWIMADLDTAFAIQEREDRPTVMDDDPRSPRIDQPFSIDNLGVVPPNILIVESSIVGANTLVGLDSRFAIRRLTNISATYRAIQEFVLRRTTAFRMDYGESAHKFYPDAWTQMTLTND